MTEDYRNLFLEQLVEEEGLVLKLARASARNDLLDRFAMAAIAGVSTNAELREVDVKSLADNAYWIADAMMAARDDMMTAREMRMPDPAKPKEEPLSRSAALAEDFLEFCRLNPGLHFWTALRKWGGFTSIAVSNDLLASVNDTLYQDTYEFKGKTK